MSSLWSPVLAMVCATCRKPLLNAHRQSTFACLDCHSDPTWNPYHSGGTTSSGKLRSVLRVRESRAATMVTPSRW
jgi:hypothetical protein